MTTVLEIAAMIDRQIPRDGFHATRVPGVRLLRAVQHFERGPLLYEPGIVIVAQGAKVGYLATEVYRYDASHYLVLSVPMPFECETFASEQEPLLAVLVGAEVTLLQEILREIDAHDEGARNARTDNTPSAPMASVPLDPQILEVVGRLLRALSSPVDARVLGETLVRELLFRVLQGPQGAALRAVARRQSGYSRIANALQRIHLDYGSALDIDTLAREANMSASTFQHNFKAVTLTSPLQYLKRVRLHKAQLLLQHDGMRISAAALQVGYESASQFSREYRRYFGRSPSEEGAEAFAAQPKFSDASV